MRASSHTVISHPAVVAVEADRHLAVTGGTGTLSIIAVARAVRDLAAITTPGSVASAFLRIDVAKPVARAVDPVEARAATFGTKLAPPPFSGVVVAGSAVAYSRRGLAGGVDAQPS